MFSLVQLNTILKMTGINIKAVSFDVKDEKAVCIKYTLAGKPGEQKIPFEAIENAFTEPAGATQEARREPIGTPSGVTPKINR